MCKKNWKLRPQIPGQWGLSSRYASRILDKNTKKHQSIQNYHTYHSMRIHAYHDKMPFRTLCQGWYDTLWLGPRHLLEMRRHWCRWESVQQKMQWCCWGEKQKWVQSSSEFELPIGTCKGKSSRYCTMYSAWTYNYGPPLTDTILLSFHFPYSIALRAKAMWSNQPKMFILHSNG